MVDPHLRSPFKSVTALRGQAVVQKTRARSVERIRTDVKDTRAERVRPASVSPWQPVAHGRRHSPTRIQSVFCSV